MSESWEDRIRSEPPRFQSTPGGMQQNHTKSRPYRFCPQWVRYTVILFGMLLGLTWFCFIDMLLMVIALSDLAATTRRLRTALWCALQMMLPKPVKMQDHPVHEEATSTERCSSPFEFYSFRL